MAADAARRRDEERGREEAIEEARAEERRRAAQAQAARDAELEERLRSLRAELAEVRAAREQVRLQVAEIATRAEPPRSSRGSWLAGGMAAVSLIAAIGATAVAWPQHDAAVAQVDAPARVETPVASSPEPIAEDAPLGEAEAPVAVAEVEPAPTVRSRRPRADRARPTVQDDLSRELDLGDDDAVLSDEFLRHADR